MTSFMEFMQTNISILQDLGSQLIHTLVHILTHKWQHGSTACFALLHLAYCAFHIVNAWTFISVAFKLCYFPAHESHESHESHALNHIDSHWITLDHI